jgi:thioredoxin 1
MEIVKSSDIQEKIDNNESFVLKMSASWCGPCKVLSEEMVKVESDVPIYDFDVESDVEFSQKFKIRNVPTTKLFKNGEEVFTFLGLKSADSISTLINEHILN